MNIDHKKSYIMCIQFVRMQDSKLGIYLLDIGRKYIIEKNVYYIYIYIYIYIYTLHYY